MTLPRPRSPALRRAIESAALWLAAWAFAPAALAQPAVSAADMQAALAAYDAGRIDEARRIFERLSDAGLPLAQYNLAVLHLRGEMPTSSVAQALSLLERAADGGFVTAMFDLGRLHEEGVATGRPDPAAAHRWYLRAAEAGSVEAQVAVATAHYLGRGAAQDPARALHWYREAAKGGDVGAQYLVASMYESGLGAARDLRLARYWYDVAARNGDPAAAGKVREIDRRAAAN